MQISSRYEPRETENRIYTAWLDSKVFHAEINPGKKPFTIVIPPPNVTGILHMGHALNITLQDLIIRHKRLKGFETLWVPGTDHAGIATQNVVERALAKEGLKKEDLGREKFIERLWGWTNKHGSTIIEQLKKLGASCDWDRTRFTMDQDYSEEIKDIFLKLYEKGLIYRGNRMINWCPRCKTALSDEESAHSQIDGWLYYLRYPVQGAIINGNDYIVVATTRPETMLGDTAVAVNPSDYRYNDLKNVKVVLPLVNRILRVVQDESVDPQFGTGVVKVTPAHDPIDFITGKRFDLEFINIMNDDATLNKNVPEEFAGMDRFEAREAILKTLADKNLIEKKEPYKISAGHCYRCHTIVEPRISLQWFVQMKPLAEKAIAVVESDKIKFYPERWKKVYLNWMHNIQDWCISRQIWWGHRIPAWYCARCSDRIIVAKSTPTECPHCGNKDLRQETDVLDTWFSSWLWPFATFTKKEELEYFYPTDTLVTASEILFFWVARMIMAGLEFQGKIPFHDVVIHGTVRDAKGIKMSKSLGNTIDPLEIIEKFGTDALRFSLMMLAASGSDVFLSEEKFLVGRNFCNKIWNATRFLFMQIEKNSIKVTDLNFDRLEPIDKWFLQEFNNAAESVDRHIENYRMNEAAKAIYEFFWHTFCDWYVEIVKDNFTENRAKILISVLIDSLKLMHPFMPYITEEIYTIIGRETGLVHGSLMRSSWPKPFNAPFNPGEQEQIYALIHTVTQIRTIKADLNLSSHKINLEISFQADMENLWHNNEDWLKRLSGIEQVIVVKRLKRTLFQSNLWNFNFAVSDLDCTAFLASLEKKVLNMESFTAKMAAKLNNENFVKNAAQEVVASDRERFATAQAELKRLKELRDAFR